MSLTFTKSENTFFVWKNNSCVLPSGCPFIHPSSRKWPILVHVIQQSQAALEVHPESYQTGVKTYTNTTTSRLRIVPTIPTMPSTFSRSTLHLPDSESRASATWKKVQYSVRQWTMLQALQSGILMSNYSVLTHFCHTRAPSTQTSHQPTQPKCLCWTYSVIYSLVPNCTFHVPHKYV